MIAVGGPNELDDNAKIAVAVGDAAFEDGPRV